MNPIRATIVPNAPWLWMTVLIAFGAFFAGSVFLRLTPVAQADLREPEPRKAFLSGGERSEIVLREILATLKTMDQRLERIETHLLEKHQ